MVSTLCFFLFSFLFFGETLFSSVKKEGLFPQTFVFKGYYDDVMGNSSAEGGAFAEGDTLQGRSGDQVVRVVRGVRAFAEFVLQSSKPVIVKVFDSGKSSGVDRLLQSLYDDISRKMGDRVSFCELDISYSENLDVLRRLGMVSFFGTVLLLFKGQSLLLPPLVLLPAVEFLTDEKKDELRRGFVDYIERRFFLNGAVTSSDISRLGVVGTDRVALFGKNESFFLNNVSHSWKVIPFSFMNGDLFRGLSEGSGGPSVSTLDKIEKLSEKLGRWLGGIRGISKKEARAYSLSKKK